jgi:hypothetical protein
LVALLLTGWSLHLWRLAGARHEAAVSFGNFCGKLPQALAGAGKDSLVLIADAHYGEQTAPSTTVAYGLNAFLNVCFPGMELQGRFLSLAEARSRRGREWSKSVNFLWNKGKLQRFRRRLPSREQERRALDAGGRQSQSLYLLRQQAVEKQRSRG